MINKLGLSIQGISGEFWIGARKAVKNGPYEQLNGAHSFDDSSSMWKKGQPNEHSKSDDMCVVIKTTESALDDKKCSEKKTFICHVTPIND